MMLRIPAACLLLCLSVAGCDTVSFREPQPTATDPIHHFPEKLHGTYVMADRTAELLISDHLILETTDYDEAWHRDSLGPGYELRDGMLIDPAGNAVAVRQQGDSVFRHHHEQDTFFAIGSGGVLKSFRGSYFLNVPLDSTRWSVCRLVLQRGRLTIGYINDAQEIDRLQAITETPDDTSGHYVFQPTRQQFRKFIRQGGFSGRDTYYRVVRQ